MSSRSILTGRGGAGNFGKENRSASGGVEDQITPTLKAEKYTTGRGGSGNIANNDHGEEARLAQDVELSIRPDSDAEFHYGRGGAANVVKASDPLHTRPEVTHHKSHEGVAEKGKEFLDKLLRQGK